MFYFFRVLKQLVVGEPATRTPDWRTSFRTLTQIELGLHDCFYVRTAVRPEPKH